MFKNHSEYGMGLEYKIKKKIDSPLFVYNKSGYPKLHK